MQPKQGMTGKVYCIETCDNYRDLGRNLDLNPLCILSHWTPLSFEFENINISLLNSSYCNYIYSNILLYIAPIHIHLTGKHISERSVRSVSCSFKYSVKFGWRCEGYKGEQYVAILWASPLFIGDHPL